MQNVDLSGWNSKAHGEFPSNVESTHLSRRYLFVVGRLGVRGFSGVGFSTVPWSRPGIQRVEPSPRSKGGVPEAVRIRTCPSIALSSRVPATRSPRHTNTYRSPHYPFLAIVDCASQTKIHNVALMGNNETRTSEFEPEAV